MPQIFPQTTISLYLWSFKMMRQLLLLFLGLILGYTSTFASNIMGGELRTSYIGKDTHLVILVVYRDCKAQPMEDTALVKFKSLTAGCNYTQNIYLRKYDCRDITPVCAGTESKCNKDTCNKYGYPNGSNPSAKFQYGIERIEYRDTLYISDTLNTSCCDFRLSYKSKYYRSLGITTCCAGEGFYTYADFNRCLAAPNSLPEFANLPDFIVCTKNCVRMNLGARDTLDFDLLSYSIDRAYSDEGISCTYNSPYSWNNPLPYKGFPAVKPYVSNVCAGFIFDTITGDLSFMPTQQQGVNLVINVHEWRRDSSGIMKKISTTRRDFALFFMDNCTNKNPVLSGPILTIVCPGDSVKFHDMAVSDPDLINQTQRDSVSTIWNNAIPKGKFSTYYKGKNQYWNFDWVPTDEEVKDGYIKTFFFTISATDNSCPSVGKYTRAYWVIVKPRVKDSISIIDKGCGNLELKTYILNNIKYAPRYLWNIPYGSSNYYGFKDGNIQYNKAGKLIIYHQSDNFGCTSDIIDSIDIKPFSEIHLPSDTGICYGDSILIRAHTFNALSPFQIYWNKSAVAGDSVFWVHPTKSSYIYATIKDTTGCRISDSLYITVHPWPTSGLLPNYTGCLGDTLNLDAWKNPSLIRNYQWADTTGKWVSNAKSIKVTQSQKLYIHLEDIYGCQSQDSVRVSIYNFPQLQIADQSICPRDSVKIYPGKYSSYQWSNGRLDSQVTIDSAGLYWLRVSGIGNCSTTDSFEVIALAEVPQHLGNDTILCYDQSITLYASKQKGSTHQFSNGSRAPATTITSAGTYWITCRSMDGCITSDTIHIGYYIKPDASFMMNADSLYNRIKFTPIVSSYPKYIWYFGDGDSSYAISPLHEYMSQQVFTPQLKVIDSNNCSISDQSQLDLMNGVARINNQKSIYIIPNPASTSITIKGMETGNYILFDMQGRMILNGSININQSIDIAQLPAGLYILEVREEKMKSMGRTLLMKE